MTTANTTPEIQAQIDQIKAELAKLAASDIPQPVIGEAVAGESMLPNPTQAEIVDQINTLIVTSARNITNNAVLYNTTSMRGDAYVDGNTSIAKDVSISGNTSANNTQVLSLGVGTAASGTAGEIRANNNITAYYSSDAMFKTNVRPIEGAVGIASAIGGKTFDWTDEYIANHGGEDGYFIVKEDFGVVAQDVLKVFPKAVRKRGDGTLAVDYAKLSVLALAAIADLSVELNELKNKIN